MVEAVRSLPHTDAMPRTSVWHRPVGIQWVIQEGLMLILQKASIGFNITVVEEWLFRLESYMLMEIQ